MTNVEQVTNDVALETLNQLNATDAVSRPDGGYTTAPVNPTDKFLTLQEGETFEQDNPEDAVILN